MTELVDRIAEVLGEGVAGMTVQEIAEQLGVSPIDVNRVIWGEPASFAWQPGNRWVPAGKKHGPKPVQAEGADPGLLFNGGCTPEVATVLGTGLKLEFSQDSLDSDAFFTVKSAGDRVVITFNSAHHLFDEFPLPLPGQGEMSEEQARNLVLALVAGWALYEDGIGDRGKRGAEDARALWGRRVQEFLSERVKRD